MFCERHKTELRPIDCLTCKGNGYKEVESDELGTFYDAKCTVCHGTGNDEYCDICAEELYE